MTKIFKKSFGFLASGEEVFAYTLCDGEGEATILSLGGALQSLKVPNKNGTLTDVVLGYDTPQEYLDKEGYLGLLIGRFANRIEKGSFTIDGVSYSLYCNDRGNHLHGGKQGFDKKLWQAEIIKDKEGNEELSLSILSPDGEENYPGNLKVQVIYSFVDCQLKIDYLGLSDKKTIINLTNHAYFNLDGAGQENGVLNHILWLDAPTVLPTDENMIPQGEFKNVQGTPFDFTIPKTLGEADADKEKDPDLQKGNGLDHCYVFKQGRDRGNPFAILYSKQTGIEMQCFTTQPAVQIYAGCCLNGEGKSKQSYGRCGAVCIETQALPNNVNVPAYQAYGSSVYAAGEIYHYITCYAFGVRK